MITITMFTWPNVLLILCTILLIVDWIALSKVKANRIKLEVDLRHARYELRHANMQKEILERAVSRIKGTYDVLCSTVEDEHEKLQIGMKNLEKEYNDYQVSSKELIHTLNAENDRLTIKLQEYPPDTLKDLVSAQAEKISQLQQQLQLKNLSNEHTA